MLTREPAKSRLMSKSYYTSKMEFSKNLLYENWVKTLYSRYVRSLTIETLLKGYVATVVGSLSSRIFGGAASLHIGLPVCPSACLSVCPFQLASGEVSLTILTSTIVGEYHRVFFDSDHLYSDTLTTREANASKNASLSFPPTALHYCARYSASTWCVSGQEVWL